MHGRWFTGGSPRFCYVGAWDRVMRCNAGAFAHGRLQSSDVKGKR
ncbi:MAG TPA: hypothetical protein VKE51_26715 [Vicinamibacterales bacterium]|nr:hypothetical protein [Vicinamibacterales bacterium]